MTTKQTNATVRKRGTNCTRKKKCVGPSELPRLDPSRAHVSSMAAAAAAAAGAGGGDHDLPVEEVGALLASFVDDPTAVFPPLPAPAAEAEPGAASGEPVDGGEGPVEGLGEIERFLMEDEDDAAGGAGVEEFLDGVLVGEDSASPLGVGGRSVDGVSAGEDEEVVGIASNDDLDSKKKRRQMRNKDSAMKSRERKKLYVKDLEMKSKYLEAECCRLSYALQCFAAENVALRQRLLKDRPVGAPTATQESAVLTETLPLVSLLWLVSFVCLFLPSMTIRSSAVPSRRERDPVKMAIMTINVEDLTKSTTNADAGGTLELVRRGRCFKSRRARMKFPWMPWLASAAC
ncbi:hypothetical protein ACP4OV_009369 [Aristida adscensionis]